MQTYERDDQTKFYFNRDADLSILRGHVVAVLGYGNQGRSQALNLRDQGISVVVGTRPDASMAQATADGFDVGRVAEIAGRADILLILMPDDVQPVVWEAEIAPNLRESMTVCFASGYNIHFGVIKPPATIDVVLVAPRMIGKGVRETFVRGDGFVSLIAVGQDASGHALDSALAIAKGIGSTRAGVILSSFEEEATLDLFMEQMGDILNLRTCFEMLTEAGYAPEVVLLELYASGEMTEIYQAACEIGLLHQLKLHSRTSQYGQQVTAERFQDAEALKASLRAVLDHIANGGFSEEWEAERVNGLSTLKAKTNENLQHPMQVAENHLFRVLGRRATDLTSATWLESEDGEKE